MKTPRVSVVVPSYRHGPYIEAALRSVADQTYADVELVVVDDASPDDSGAKIAAFAARPEVVDRFGGRIKCLLWDVNRGADAAINAGLARATGDVLTVLNSDDRYAPGRLATMVAALGPDVRRPRLAFSRVAVIDEAGVVDRAGDFAAYLASVQDSIATLPSVGFAALRQNVGISTGNFVFTRALRERIGGFAPLKYCHDWDFLLRAVTVTEPVFVDETLYEYRTHRTNSFLDLGGVAEAETRQVLSGFFGRVRGGRFENDLVPGPHTWPGVFEVQMTSWSFWDHWHAAEGRPSTADIPPAGTAVRP